MFHMICTTVVSGICIPGKHKINKNPTPTVEEDYLKKVISKLPETDEKTIKPRHFNGKFSNIFNALWIRPSIFFYYKITFIY